MWKRFLAAAAGTVLVIFLLAALPANLNDREFQKFSECGTGIPCTQVSGPTANDGTIVQNPVLIGVEARSTQPTAATDGNLRRPVGSVDGVQFYRFGGPVPWSCSLDAIAATLTQCQAAPGAGLKLYLTDIVAQSTTATAGLFLIRYGTGTNCGTGTTSLLPAAATVVRLAHPANTAAPTSIKLQVPLATAANNAICAVGVATNTLTVQMSGYTAP